MAEILKLIGEDSVHAMDTDLVPTLNVQQGRNAFFLLFDENNQYIVMNLKEFDFPDISVVFFETGHNKSYTPQSTRAAADQLTLGSSIININKSIPLQVLLDEDWKNYLSILTQMEIQVRGSNYDPVKYDRFSKTTRDSSVLILDNSGDYLFHVNFYYTLYESVTSLNFKANSSDSLDDIIFTLTIRHGGMAVQKDKNKFKLNSVN